MSIYQNPKVLSRIKRVIAAKKKAVNKDHLCMLPSCSEIAINSHIIQRSRFLEPIANKDKKLMCLQTREMYPGKLPKFQRIPIRGILTFKGFCKLHDQQIFSEIEKADFDLTNQKHLILFNYRALCHELRKKMIIVEWMQESIGKSDDITAEAKERYNASLNGFKLGIKDLEYYKAKLEDDLIKGTSQYKFEVHKLPRREVVTSACFNLENLTDEEAAKVDDENWEDEPLKFSVITIFPTDTELIVIFGYLKEHEKEAEFFKSELGGISLDFINKILLEWVETWACSEEFYKDNIVKNEEEVQTISMMANTVYPANQNRLPNIME